MSFDADTKMQFLYALRSKGVTDTRVLTAMEQVDRAAFVRGIFADRAYEDMPLPIACGQTISQPSVVGLMTQALQVNPRDKVLEIGTGSGYQAAILSKLARRVYKSTAIAAWPKRRARSLLINRSPISSPLPPMAAMACLIRRRLTGFCSLPPLKTRRGLCWRNCAWAGSWCCLSDNPTPCKA